MKLTTRNVLLWVGTVAVGASIGSVLGGPFSVWLVGMAWLMILVLVVTNLVSKSYKKD